MKISMRLFLIFPVAAVLLSRSASVQAQVFTGSDYTAPNVPFMVPANRSPYEDMLNTSVYNSAPAALNTASEPTGIPGQTFPFDDGITYSNPHPEGAPANPANKPFPAINANSTTPALP